MMPVFKLILLSLISLLSTFTLACSFKEPVISLSGPMTLLIEDLGLIHDKNLKGISVFNPVKEYKGERYGGGVFLGEKFFKNKSSLIFFDKSKSLESLFTKNNYSKFKIVDTRNKSPFVVVEELLKILIPILDINCGERLKAYKHKISTLENSDVFKTKISMKALFFLGEVIREKLPEQVIVNDGIVSFLKQRGLETYKSKLDYASWSSKLLKTVYKDYTYIGLKDSKADVIKIERLGEKHINLSFRGIFIPGIAQIKFLSQFLRNSASYR